MVISFGLNQNDADWSDSQASLGELHLGPEGMLSFLQTRLGLGGIDEPAVIRIAQYVKRMEAVDSPGAWFHGSFKIDPWSSSRQLLSWRDELILAGWDTEILPAGISLRLDALSAIEKRTEPLAQGFADKLREVLNDLDYLDVSCIQTIKLAEPLELLPYLWQLIFKKLGELGISVKEAQLPAAGAQNSNLAILQRLIVDPDMDVDKEIAIHFNPSDDSLVLLDAETEWEAAEALAMWLAAKPAANDQINMIVPNASGILNPALHRFGLPQTGKGKPSGWQAHLQILPLVFANAWKPIDLKALVALLTLPISPVPSDARYRLLRALKKEAGIKGEAWNEMWEEIKNNYLNPPSGTDRKAKKPAEVDKLLKHLDAMLVSERYKPSDGIPEAAIIERCQWIIGSLTPQCEKYRFLAKPIRQAGDLQRLAAGRGKISRVELDRILVSLVGEELSDVVSEAAPWRVAAHPGGISVSRPVLIWWNFINQPGSQTTYWNPPERVSLMEAGIMLDKPGLGQSREVFAWKNAFLKARETAILVRPQKLYGEQTITHPFQDMIAAFAGKINGKDAAKNSLRNSTSLFFTHENWRLSGREGKTIPAALRGLPQGQNEYSIPKQLVGVPKSTSYSDMSLLIGCPLRWVIEKAAKVYPSNAASIPALKTSIGTLCHRIIQDIFTQSAGPWTHEDACKEVERLFDEKIESIAIELSADGKNIERSRCRQELGNTVYDLGKLLDKEQLKVEGFEVKVEETLCGVPFTGSLDMLLRNKNSDIVVMDLKRTPKEEYKRKEIEEGKALQLALYAWALEEERSGVKITAGYFVMPDNTWLPVSQEELRQVFLETKKAWQDELEKLAQGVVSRGKDMKQDISTAALTLAAPCYSCKYTNLCKIGDNNTADTAKADINEYY